MSFNLTINFSNFITEGRQALKNKKFEKNKPSEASIFQITRVVFSVSSFELTKASLEWLTIGLFIIDKTAP